AMLAALPAVAAVSALAARRLSERPEPVFHQLTFRRGYVQNARFSADGRSIVYSAAWDGAPLKVHLKQPESPEPAVLDLPSANVLAVAASGELALALDCKLTHLGICSGTLASGPLLGGAPREIQEHVQEADWAEGGSLAIVRDLEGGGARLEL